MKSKLILLAMCMILCFLTIASASASEIDNTTTINDNPNININQETNFDENTLISTENDLLKDKSEGTFTDLANDIANAGSTLNLNRNYAYTSSDSNYKDGISINKKITINGNGYTIDGNNKARAFKVSANSVTLNNIAFVNCYADYDGGAIKLTGDYGTIKDSTFNNCHSGTYGGAINVYAWDAVISGCSFNKCSSNLGGAIYQQGCSGSAVRNCNFVDCESERGGSAVYWSKSDDGTLSGCSFNRCYSDSGSGAVYWQDSNYGTLSDCSFTYCRSYFEGGAIYLKSNNCIIKGCTFFSPKKGQDDYKVIGVDNTIINGEDTAIAVNKNNYYKYGSGELVATLTTASGKAISGADVVININNAGHHLKTNTNGQVKLSVASIKPGTYIATIKFEGNNNYAPSSATANVIINKMDTTLTAKYDASSKKIVATVKDANGKPVKGLKVGFALNGVKYVTTDANGQAKYSTAGLTDGTYKVTVQASGNEIYKDSNKETVTFSIGSKEMSKIFLRNALYFVTQTKLVQVTLWDGNNQPLANKTVYIRAYDSVWHGVTDENGDAFVRVGIGFGTHDATVSFDGDDQYFGSEKAGYIRVIKQTPSVMVRGADTMFKATNPVKIVKVHLRDRYDQPIPEGSKIVLKLNGKTYIGFTDAEGVARIAISINTVGTFTAQAMYGGNSAFNEVKKDIKIRIV